MSRVIRRSKREISLTRESPVLLYACLGVDAAPWLDAFRFHMPDLEIRIWPDIGNAGDIDFVLAWKQPEGSLQALPNLKVIFSMGAGVEHLLADKTLPAGIPLARMVDPGLAAGMNEFVLMSVLRYHRRMPEYEANQRARRWEKLIPKLPEDRRIGLLGLGALGAAMAQTLTGLGFDVAGWSRTPKNLDGVLNFHGKDGFVPLLNRTEILVCLLPLTPDTENIMNTRSFAALPRGAFFINVARGRHVVEEDLLAALDADHIAGATLDVFREEPLPPHSPFWTHPKVTVIPHCAALTQPKTAARTVVDNVRRYLAGEALRHVVDPARGY